MNILYIYRNKSKGFSIERVFKPIEIEMKKNHNVDSIYLPSQNALPTSLIKDALYVRNHIKDKTYDIIHITGEAHYLAFLIKPFVNRKKTKVVVTVHDIGFYFFQAHRLYHKFLWINTLKSADLITFISHKSYNETINIASSLRKEQCVVIPNTYSPSFVYNEKEINTSCPIVLQIGTGPNKNIERIAIALNGTKYKYRIIGKLTKEQESLLRKYNVDYSNAFNLSESEIIEEYRQCDIVTFVSTYEGFGLPIIEGQASGRPVMTSNISPMREISNESCALTDPYDPKSIRKAFDDIINNYQVFITKGLDNVKRFSVEKISETYELSYKRIFNRI